MDSEIQLKPFDLIAALAGAPVVTKLGERVEQLTLFRGVKDDQPLYCVIGHDIEHYTLTGGWWGSASGNKPSARDLVMA